MRPLVLLAFCLPLMTASTVDARLFWQTYGSTVSSSNGSSSNGCGAGCSRNSNQDYFVPRYSSSGRYGLFSPCMADRTTSPACKTSHPFYPGYCSVYGPAYYGRRNHVYQTYCGCVSNEACSGHRQKGCDLAAAYCQGYSIPNLPVATGGPLPNVEPSGMFILGSISPEGDDLLANLALTPGDDPEEKRIFLDPQTITPSQALQALGIQQTEGLIQPVPSP